MFFPRKILSLGLIDKQYYLKASDKKLLKAHLTLIEEAEKRDHRKLGKELELFMMSDYGPGFPFFLPKGMELRNVLETLWRKIHKRAGYKETKTPIMLNKELWETSGHWEHYKDDMFVFVMSYFMS